MTTASTLSTRGNAPRTSCVMCTWYNPFDKTRLLRHFQVNCIQSSRHLDLHWQLG